MSEETLTSRASSGSASRPAMIFLPQTRPGIWLSSGAMRLMPAGAASPNCSAYPMAATCGILARAARGSGARAGEYPLTIRMPGALLQASRCG